MSAGQASLRPLAVRSGLAALGVVGASIVLIGALHAPWARPLLMRLGGCPIESDPLVIERAQREGAHARRGDQPSPTRVVHGFHLGEDGPSEVEAWASAHGAQCTAHREGLWLGCTNVSGTAIGMQGALERLDFTFRSGDRRLVSVTAYQQAPDLTANAASFEAARAELRAALGEPSFHGGAPGGTEAYATATVAYRYSDLVVDLTTTRIPSRGSSVFQSIVLATD
jgi:hypothetical protein